MKKSTKIFILAASTLVALSALFLYSKSKTLELTTIDPILTKPVPVKPLPIVPVEPQNSYHTITLGTAKIGAQLVEAVGQEHLAEVLSLNRVDIKHLQNNQIIVVPDTFSDDPLALASFPRVVPELSSIPKMMFVSQKIQEFALYESGNLVRFGAVSTGKKTTQTPNKLYYTNWKGKLVTSTVDDAWIMPWYFNLDNLEGVSMHQFDLPGYPASHACVRMYESDAKFIFDWADQWILSKDEKLLASGTPVLIFDTFEYGKTAPWKKLAEDSKATIISLEHLESELAPHLEDIKKKQEQRTATITP